MPDGAKAFPLPTEKGEGAIRVQCSAKVLKPWLASPESELCWGLICYTQRHKFRRVRARGLQAPVGRVP